MAFGCPVGGSHAGKYANAHVVGEERPLSLSPCARPSSVGGCACALEGVIVIARAA